MPVKPSIFDLSFSQLESHLKEWGEPAYRARQVYRQLYVQNVNTFADMSDLSLKLRERLAGYFSLDTLKLEKMISCDKGLTRKVLLSLPDGSPVEAVLMVYPDRATVCVSSQSGCPMACVFCATGKLGFLHDLTAGQIIEQVLWAERELRSMDAEMGKAFPEAIRARLGKEEHALTNIVFMGMGEAFNNYAPWWDSVERLHDPSGYNMGARHFTVSTVGLIPGIQKLAEESLPINLAVSLHAADDETRSDMMPVNRSYPIADLIAATREYITTTGRRVSFEYVLLQEKNDTPVQAEALVQLLRGKDDAPLICHVNLIPWNPVPGAPLSRSGRKRVLDFQRILQSGGVPCTIRVERGMEIGAACGQLAGTSEEVDSQPA